MDTEEYKVYYMFIFDAILEGREAAVLYTIMVTSC